LLCHVIFTYFILLLSHFGYYFSKRLLACLQSVKPFEKLRATDKDTIRLSWFVRQDAVNRAIRDGEVLQVSDVQDGIAMHACDDRPVVDEVKQYFSDEAWEAVSEMMASINTLTWCCCLCDEADVASPSGKRKRMKSIQCDHCLVWLHYHCAALTRKPRGYYF